MSKSKEFIYVVGYPWEDDEPDNLCIYSYGGEIQKGTKKQAKKFLAYVKRASDKEDRDKYAIYEVTFKKLEKK